MARFCCGPGIGIQISSGKYKGRIIIPIYYDHDYVHLSSSCVMYSDDHGKTWRRGTSPNDGRIINGIKIDSRSILIKEAYLNECQPVELSDGRVALYMRNHSGKQRTAIAESSDGGHTWGEIHFDETLIDPTCQSSIFCIPDKKNVLLWSNPADEKERINGTLRISYDDGKTWAKSVKIDDQKFMYSCIAYHSDGIIFVLYENGDGYGDIFLKRFSLETLEELHE
jgi:sialidase-1